MNKPIGILDSGIGGLSIWQEITHLLPHESTVYLADSLNCPYGGRKAEEICILAKHMIDFLLEKDVKLIVVACNTITVNCLDVLRHEYPHIPIIGIVPVIKTAAEISRNKKIGILSTASTAQSQYQKRLISQFASDCEVINIGTNELVPFIERGITEGQEINAVLNQVLEPFQKAEVDTVALGCSHYPFIGNAISHILGSEVTILDSGKAIARHVERVLSNKRQLNNLSSSQHQFFTTGDQKQFEECIVRMAGNRLSPERISLPI